MHLNPLKKLETFGQSIWLDYIERDLMTSGKLKQLINEMGLKGMTSNPTIFEQAIDKSNDYSKDIERMKQQKKEVNFIYETLTQQDVGSAADEFINLYHQSEGKEGFVSLEVNPHLAHDTEGTIEEARRLWKALDRLNVLIKVPATSEGLAAIRQLTQEGISVNVTLLFGLPRYREVAAAYIEGLKERVSQGQSISHIRSFASFFLSRIDVLVDPELDKIIEQNNDKSPIAKKMKGQVAIASAKMAYQIYKDIFKPANINKLIENAGQTQHLLWASTSTKNPDYSDIKYVEPLIGHETVNTLPMETLNHYLDHGHPTLSLEQDLDNAKWVFQTLPALGIDIDKVTQQLEKEGVEKFNESYDKLIASLQRKIS